jgi:hypothetical protein
MSGARTLGATYSRPKGGRVPSPLGVRARPPHYWPRSSLISSCSAAFALAPLRSVARDLGWCDHVYPRWGGHNTTPRCVARLLVLGTPASLIGSELPGYRAETLISA